MTSYKKKKTNEDMKKVLRLTESELIRIIKTVIKEQTGPLNIDPNQQISLTCRNSMGQRISFDGTVETSSRNASWGTVDPDTNIYSESEETVPEFFVTKKEEFGVTEGQDITKSFYIAPITAEMSAFLGITGGTVLLHYKNGSPIGNKDIRSNRFYCRVVSTDNQFGNELRRHQVNGGI